MEKQEYFTKPLPSEEYFQPRSYIILFPIWLMLQIIIIPFLLEGRGIPWYIWLIPTWFYLPLGIKWMLEELDWYNERGICPICQKSHIGRHNG